MLIVFCCTHLFYQIGLICEVYRPSTVRFSFCKSQNTIPPDRLVSVASALRPNAFHESFAMFVFSWHIFVTATNGVNEMLLMSVKCEWELFSDSCRERALSGVQLLHTLGTLASVTTNAFTSVRLCSRHKIDNTCPVRRRPGSKPRLASAAIYTSIKRCVLSLLPINVSTTLYVADFSGVH